MPDDYTLAPPPPSSVAMMACPSCRAQVPTTATLCVKCGADLRAAAKTAAAPATPTGTPSTWPEFAPASASKQKAFLIVGCLLTLAAAIATIYYGGRAEQTGGIETFLRHIGRALLTFYSIALHTGTGVVAIWVASKITRHQFGSFEGAVTRMFVLVSAFFFMANIQLPLGEVLTPIASLLMAAGLYWLLAIVVFNKKVEQVNVLSVVHLTLFVLLWLGYILYGWVKTAPGPAPATPAPAHVQPQAPPAATPAATGAQPVPPTTGG